MTILIIIAVISILFSFYVVWFRPWLRDKEWAKPFFRLIEPIEIALWSKSETILKARVKMAVGLLLTILTQIGTLDITPLMPVVPEKYQSAVRIAFNMIPTLLIIGGWVDQKLRQDTTKPLEVVAMPMDAPPEVKEIVEEAAKANKVAAAVVTAEAKKV